MIRAQRINFTGKFSARDEAASSLKVPGDAALVHRGVDRMLLMNCPCGCGDVLVINLDRRAGPAWKIYRRGEAISLFPSYWRDTKCESHFILWKNNLFWCDWDDDNIWSSSNYIEDKVLSALTANFVNYEDLAEQLQEVPWDVLQACHALVRRGCAANNIPKRKGEFKRSKQG